MGFTYLATGIVAATDTATPFANLTYTLPGSTQTGDLLCVFYGGKPYNTVPSTPADYTARSGGANGTTAMGAGTGSVYAVAFTKTHDGSEANPASTFTAQYSPGVTAALAVRNSESTTWTVSSCKGSDAAATGTGFSATGDATLGYTAGDVAVVLLVHNDDSSSDTSFGLTIAGCTVANVTQRLTGTLTTATGNDARMYVLTAEITAGTASGAPVVTATTGSGDSDGQAVFLRLAPPPGATVVTPAAAATSEARPPTVTAVQSPTVTVADPAVVTSAAQVPAVTVTTPVEVIATPATISAAATPPALAAGAGVTATQAAATAAATAPAVTATRSAAASAVPATGSLSAPAPEVTAGAKLVASAATATTTAGVPAATGAAVVAAPPATKTCSAPAPLVDATRTATVTATPAVTAARARAPEVTATRWANIVPPAALAGVAAPAPQAAGSEAVTAVLAPVSLVSMSARPPFVFEYMPAVAMSGASSTVLLTAASRAPDMAAHTTGTPATAGDTRTGDMTGATTAATMSRS